jgi:hypothetical protein
MSSAARLIPAGRKISRAADAKIAGPADDGAAAASYRREVNKRKEHRDERP